MRRPSRRLALALVAGAVALVVAVPVVAGRPFAATPPGQENKPDKEPAAPVSVEGTVRKTTDEGGQTVYTVTAGGKTWTLSAGPSWFLGNKNPLEAFVGKSVAISGSARAGSTELDVETVDGTALREPGKPPWAGGPWVVGERHPGWKEWMADGKPGGGHGRDNAPGQQKQDAQEP
jgi:hypothetical protein